MATIAGSLILFSSYVLLFLISFVSLISMRFHRQSLKSFKALFLVLCFFWTLLRAILGLMRGSWPSYIRYSIFWAPVNIQFATFSLLVVYFAQMVHRGAWDRKFRVRFLAGYICVNLMFLILFVVWIVIEVKFDVNENKSNQGHSIFSASVFLLLIMILAVYSVALRSIDKNSPCLRSHSKTVLTIFSLVICLILGARSFFDFLDVNVGFETGKSSTLAFNWLSVWLYFTWEIVPTALLIYVFNVRSRKAGTNYAIMADPWNDSLLANQGDINNNDPQAFLAGSQNSGMNASLGYHHNPSEAVSIARLGSSQRLGSHTSSSSSLFRPAGAGPGAPGTTLFDTHQYYPYFNNDVYYQNVIQYTPVNPNNLPHAMASAAHQQQQQQQHHHHNQQHQQQHNHNHAKHQHPPQPMHGKHHHPQQVISNANAAANSSSNNNNKQGGTILMGGYSSASGVMRDGNMGYGGGHHAQSRGSGDGSGNTGAAGHVGGAGAASGGGGAGGGAGAGASGGPASNTGAGSSAYSTGGSSNGGNAGVHASGHPQNTSSGSGNSNGSHSGGGNHNSSGGGGGQGGQGGHGSGGGQGGAAGTVHDSDRLSRKLRGGTAGGPGSHHSQGSDSHHSTHQQNPQQQQQQQNQQNQQQQLHPQTSVLGGPGKPLERKGLFANDDRYDSDEDYPPDSASSSLYQAHAKMRLEGSAKKPPNPSVVQSSSLGPPPFLYLMGEKNNGAQTGGGGGGGTLLSSANDSDTTSSED